MAYLRSGDRDGWKTRSARGEPRSPIAARRALRYRPDLVLRVEREELSAAVALLRCGKLRHCDRLVLEAGALPAAPRAARGELVQRPNLSAAVDAPDLDAAIAALLRRGDLPERARLAADVRAGPGTPVAAGPLLADPAQRAAAVHLPHVDVPVVLARRDGLFRRRRLTLEAGALPSAPRPACGELVDRPDRSAGVDRPQLHAAAAALLRCCDVLQRT